MSEEAVWVLKRDAQSNGEGVFFVASAKARTDTERTQRGRRAKAERTQSGHRAGVERTQRGHRAGIGRALDKHRTDAVWG